MLPDFLRKMPCEEVPELFEKAVEWIYSYGDEFILETLKAHDVMVESREDWTECQKNARRKIIIQSWMVLSNQPVDWTVTPDESSESSEVSSIGVP